jgi:hypothetical protein
MESSFPSLPVHITNIHSYLEALTPILGLVSFDSKARDSFLWFHRSLESRDEVFRFLAAWIACETISGSADTDVSKIVSVLHRHFTGVPGYNCPDLKSAKEFLLLGRLHGMRGQLAHRGRTKGITSEVASYVQMLFAEMAFASYGLKSFGIVSSFLHARRSNIEQSIREASS